jgi:16S rRNA (cytosine967-C5)-methyltransferase
MDLYENKLREIQRQSGRLGLSIIETVVHDGTKAIDAFAGTADKVICDVPCSGLGVLRKKPEIRYRAVENQGRALAEKQLAILEAASTYLKPGGTLLYSTCTVNRVENQEVTKAFLKEHSSFRVLREEQLLPDEEPEDGFYYCTMRLE